MRRFLWFCCVVCFSVGGGLLNRMRGGWHPTDWFTYEDKICKSKQCYDTWGILLHDSAPRWLVGLGVAIITLIFYNKLHLKSLLCCNKRPSRRTKRNKNNCSDCKQRCMLALYNCILISIQFYVGWGIYMSVGHDSTNYSGRYGIFDWLIGRNQPYFSEKQRWYHDVCGMSLRGTLATMPIGLLFYVIQSIGIMKHKSVSNCAYCQASNINIDTFNYNSIPICWELGLSGLAMGFIYDAGYNVHFLSILTNNVNFANGTPLAEFLFGLWLFFVLSITMFTYDISCDFTNSHTQVYDSL